jgi:glutathione S-transferase
LYESLICNEYLEDLAPGHLPSSPAAAAAVRLLIDQFGAKVGPAFGKVMFGGGEGEAAAAAGKELDEALRLVTQVTWQ